MGHEDGDEVRRVAELMQGIRTSMLTTTVAEGHLVSRPMAVQQVEFDGDLWFFSEGDARKVRQGPRQSRCQRLVLVGQQLGVPHRAGGGPRDPDRAEELRNPVVGAWFPDGPRSPGLVLLRVDAHAAEYWDTPGGRVATVLSFVRAKMTGEPYDGGDNEVVRRG